MNIEFRSQLRSFGREVRKILAAEGHSNVMFRSAWVREGEGSDAFLVDVPIGPELIATLRPRTTLSERPTTSDWTREANTFASALITLAEGEDDLLRYAEAMRSATASEIRNARGQGLDIRLVRTGFMPVYAHALSRSDRHEALNYMIAEINIEVAWYNLRREVVGLTLEEPEEVADALSEYLDTQRARQTREDELEEMDADLEISDLSLDILSLTSREPAEILTDLLRDGTQVFDLAEGQRIGVINDGGLVKTSFQSDKVSWNGDLLQLRGEDVSGDPADFAGKPLLTLASDPVFATRSVLFCDDLGGGRLAFRYDERRYTFNSANGRIESYDGQTSIAA